MLKPDEQQRLFENTARAIGAALEGSGRIRHIGNFQRLTRHTERV